MLSITVPAREFYDELNNEFISIKRQTLQLEHSLVSVSKWEAKWKKPFLARNDKTEEETLDYIRCMTLTQNVDPLVYVAISFDKELMDSITEYIEDSHTATWFKEDQNKPRSREIITSEVIYGWMVGLNIPFECQKWHLNRLLTLVKVINEQNKAASGKQKKMSPKDLASRNASLNAARRKAMHSSG